MKNNKMTNPSVGMSVDRAAPSSAGDYISFSTKIMSLLSLFPSLIIPDQVNMKVDEHGHGTNMEFTPLEMSTNKRRH